MNNKEIQAQAINNFLDLLSRDDCQRKFATVKIGETYCFEKVLVEVSGQNGQYILKFQDEKIISLMEGQKEFEVETNTGRYELSNDFSTLIFCYAGNHIEIKWFSQTI